MEVKDRQIAKLELIQLAGPLVKNVVIPYIYIYIYTFAKCFSCPRPPVVNWLCFFQRRQYAQRGDMTSPRPLSYKLEELWPESMYSVLPWNIYDEYEMPWARFLKKILMSNIQRLKSSDSLIGLPLYVDIFTFLKVCPSISLFFTEYKFVYVSFPH